MQKIMYASALLMIFLLASCQQGGTQNPVEIAALSKAGFKAGKDFIVLKNPLPVGNAGNLHIAEFFWYGCGHCYKVEQPIKRWQAMLPSSVKFEKVPASWKETMELHARAHYIAEKLAAPGMTDALFPTILEMRKNNDVDAHKANLQLFFTNYHIDEKDFDALWNDENILALVDRADQWQKQAKITGTPAIVINGKYLINNNALEEISNIVGVADKMVRALLNVDTKESAIQ